MNTTNHGGKREGAGRRPLGEAKMMTLSVRLSPEARKRLDDFIYIRPGVGRREAVERAILGFL